MVRVLVLPRSSALSVREADPITEWVRAGGVLIVDGDAGTYDEHSRKLSESRLAALLRDSGQGTVLKSPGLMNYHQARLRTFEQPMQATVRKMLERAGIRPPFETDAGVGVETHVRRRSPKDDHSRIARRDCCFG